MTRRQWHLDYKPAAGLFDLNWPDSSNKALHSLFSYLDKSEGPILSMIPPGISPAGFAAAAALYFLPGISSPPSSPCKIALYPGLRFVKDLEKVIFSAELVLESSRIARTMERGSFYVNRQFTLLQERRKERLNNKKINVKD